MKKDRSLEAYKNCGALIRLLYDIAIKAYIECRGTFTVPECNRLDDIIYKLKLIKADFDTILYNHHPDEGNLNAFFYGGFGRGEEWLEREHEEELENIAFRRVNKMFGTPCLKSFTSVKNILQKMDKFLEENNGNEDGSLEARWAMTVAKKIVLEELHDESD